MAVSGRVLVVDDIPSNRMVARTMLELQGWTVLTASDGREALDTLATTQCDLGKRGFNQKYCQRCENPKR